MNRKILDIEVLRGIAILFVIIQHANINLFTWSTPGLARFYTYFGGAIGVDLFFAISGFVIAKSLLPKLEQAQGNDVIRDILKFWTRRAWRLLPSAWLWLFITLAMVFFYNESKAFGSARANIEATVAGIIQAANFRLAEAFGQHEYGASAVYWSLSLEEQFYLVLPLLAVLLRRHLIYLLVVIVGLQICDPRDSMYSIMFRTDALCLGVLLAIFFRKSGYDLTIPTFLRSRMSSFCFVTLLLALLLMLGSHHLNVTPYRLSFVALFVAVLVLIASHNRDLIFYKINFLRKPLIWVGERSFAMYLTHMPCFFIVRETWYRFTGGTAPSQDQLILFSVAALVLIFSLSNLNYRVIELPLRNKGVRISNTMLTSER